MTRHALAVVRAQPWHIGHQYLLNCMIEENDFVTLCLGSCNKPISWQNPWSKAEREQMLSNANEGWPHYESVSIDDLGDKGNWPKFVLGNVQKHYEEQEELWGEKDDYLDPTHYYCGGEFEASFWQNSNLEIVIKNRSHGVMSGSEIRTTVAMGDDSWKPYIPWATSWDKIEGKQEFLLECMKGKI